MLTKNKVSFSWLHLWTFIVFRSLLCKPEVYYSENAINLLCLFYQFKWNSLKSIPFVVFRTFQEFCHPDTDIPSLFFIYLLIHQRRPAHREAFYIDTFVRHALHFILASYNKNLGGSLFWSIIIAFSFIVAFGVQSVVELDFSVSCWSKIFVYRAICWVNWPSSRRS